MTFIDYCRLHGVTIDSLPPEGRWRRYKTTDKPHHRNGAVKYMGDHGFVQNHATMTEVAVWREEGDSKAARPIDQQRIKRQRDKDRAYRVEAIHSARAFWINARPLCAPHPYVQAKGLEALGCAGLRTHDDLLVIPVLWNNSAVISVQTISPSGEKKFWPGAPVKGGAYTLRRERSAVTVLVEGLSTGLAVFQALRSASVVVCFNAGNLLPVIERIKPFGSVAIAADNDHKTHARTGTNPGIEQATNAASLIGAGVVWPEGIEGTDFADCVREWGDAAHRRIERLILAKSKYVMGVAP